MHTTEYNVSLKRKEEIQHVLIGKYPNILTLKSKMQNNTFRVLPFVGRKRPQNLIHNAICFHGHKKIPVRIEKKLKTGCF